MMAIISPKYHDGGVSYCSDGMCQGSEFDGPIYCSEIFQGSGFDDLVYCSIVLMSISGVRV
jgi:hypothetical protein